MIFADIHLSSLDTLIALVVTLFLVASVLIAFRLDLTLSVKGAVFIFIPVVPSVVYINKLGSKHMLQRADVTWLFPEGPIIPDMPWSGKKGYCCGWFSSKRGGGSRPVSGFLSYGGVCSTFRLDTPSKRMKNDIRSPRTILGARHTGNVG